MCVVSNRRQVAPHDPRGDGLAPLVDRLGEVCAFFDHLVPGHAGFDHELVEYSKQQWMSANRIENLIHNRGRAGCGGARRGNRCSMRPVQFLERERCRPPFRLRGQHDVGFRAAMGSERIKVEIDSNIVQDDEGALGFEDTEDVQVIAIRSNIECAQKTGRSGPSDQ